MGVSPSERCSDIPEVGRWPGFRKEAASDKTEPYGYLVQTESVFLFHPAMGEVCPPQPFPEPPESSHGSQGVAPPSHPATNGSRRAERRRTEEEANNLSGTEYPYGWKLRVALDCLGDREKH